VRVVNEREARTLGSLESAVMHVLWQQPDSLTVRQVLELVNRGREVPLAYTTVMTVLSRLHDKAAVSREPAGRGFRYQASVGNEAHIAVRDVVREYGDAAVAGFVDEARADPRLLRRLRRLLADDR
jgi:predicted transcriptional regulator